MITTKQRATLKALAHHLSPSIQIGKDGLTENVKAEIDVVLENKELVKIKLLKTADLEAKTLINHLATELAAEPVLAVGGVMVLYRFSKKKGIKHIEL
jgi:RNA-binding protein